jgi:tRNA (cytidine/uridine-2'-O-)-methyltransferase
MQRPEETSFTDLRPAIVLVQPRIPQNVGAIGRLCAATRSRLHVVRPIPFLINDANLRRAGLDYLGLLDIAVHDDWQAAQAALAPRRLWFLTRFAEKSIYDTDFNPTDALVFGSEPSGLPEEIRATMAGRDLRIPMPEERARCLNLSTAAAITLFELLRQTGEFSSGAT